MEASHERLFDLIESRSFEELSPEERAFVLEHLSEAEYTLQRKVIAASSALEYGEEEPLPLVLPRERKHFFNRSIPLYQALLGAACLLLIFLAMGNKKQVLLNWHFPEYPAELSFTNGASSIQTIHDTVIREIPVLRSASDIIRDTVTIVQTILQQSEQPVQAIGSLVVYPELSEKLLENKGTSCKEDQTSRFLPNTDLVNTMK